MSKSLPVLEPPAKPHAGPLHLSGILVRTEPSRLDEVLEALGSIPGVKIHQREDSSGKAVITHEAPSRKEAEAGLYRIRSAPGVLLAEPVYHYVEPGAGSCADDKGDRS